MMQNDKVCYICEEHKNPYYSHPGYDERPENPENFIEIEWLGNPEENGNHAHDECWEMEK